MAFEDAIREISKIVDDPIGADVVALNAGEMVKEDRDLSVISPTLIIEALKAFDSAPIFISC